MSGEKKANLEVLRRIMIGPDHDKKIRALQILKAQSASNAKDLLIQFLSKEKEAVVLEQLIITISELGGEECLKFIEPFADHSSPLVSGAARTAIEQISEEIKLKSKIKELKGILGLAKKRVEKRKVQTRIVEPVSEPTESVPEITPITKDDLAFVMADLPGEAKDGDILAKVKDNSLSSGLSHQVHIELDSTRFITTRKKLGEILVEEGYLTDEEFEEILKMQAHEPHTMIGQILLRDKLVTEQELMKCLALQYQIPFVDLKDFIPPQDLILECGITNINRFYFVPIKYENNLLYVAIADPTFRKGIEELEVALEKKIKIVIADKKQINELINKYAPLS